MICETCQLYEAHLSRCLEYGLLTQMPATCPKYVEDAWVVMAKRRRESKADMVAEAEVNADPNCLLSFEDKVLQLAREEKLSGYMIAQRLGVHKRKVYKVLAKHGLYKPASSIARAANEVDSVGRGECEMCCHEVVCAIKEKAQANKDWAICRHWMKKVGMVG